MYKIYMFIYIWYKYVHIHTYICRKCFNSNSKDWSKLSNCPMLQSLSHEQKKLCICKRKTSHFQSLEVIFILISENIFFPQVRDINN